MSRYRGLLTGSGPLTPSMSSTSGDVIRQAAIHTRLELWLKGYAVWQEAGTSPASPDFLLIFRCVPGCPAVEWQKKTEKAERQKKTGKEAAA